MATMGGVSISSGRSWRTHAAACMFLALLLLIAWPTPVRATTLENMTIEQLSRRATMVVEGTVVSTAVEQTPAGVRTAVRIKVKDSLKGSASAVQTVYVPGGVLPDGTQVVVDSMASFRPGQSCYVFVDARGWVIGGFQGKVGVTDGHVTGSGETIASMSRRVNAALGNAGPVVARPFRDTPAPALPAAAAAYTSAGGWFKQSSGTTASLSAVFFSDVTHGWAVGAGGAILATTDGGATWSAQSSATTERLGDVAFPDATHGWAVGNRGAILATTNGGATWSKQSSGSSANLYGVAFPDAAHGWAVGGVGGVILATTDGGATWSKQTSGSNAWLYGVAFSDSTHGWAVGSEHTILATTDGGATWRVQSSGSSAALLAVASSDATHGWAVGSAHTVLATTNGGAAWIAQSPGSNADLKGVAFSGPSHGWAVGWDGTILATTDGGATWDAQSSGSSIVWLNAVAFSDASHGWAVGDNGTILATTNGGWSPAPGSPTISSISPGEASAGTDTHVTISGTGFGSTRGKVEFSYGRKSVMRISAGDISSWTDTRINCAVPTAMINEYGASAGSGPVVVTTSTSKESNPYDFTVPFGYGGSKWASPGVTYLVNTSGIDSVLRESLIDRGMAQWNGAGSAFRFTDGGTTSAGYADDGLTIISWDNGLPTGVIAWATSYIRGGIVSQCDVQFSNALPWGDGAPGSNTIDVQTTAMHEVGHWLKLRDQYMPGDSSKVMYGYASENQQKRTLSAGDIAGIRWIYPTGGPPPTPTVTLKLSGLRSGAMKLGTSVTVTGKVTPTSLAEGKVTLTAQRKKGATWAALKTAAATISASGAYSWKYKPAKKGAYRLQAAIAETEAHAAATTKWLMFTVK